MTRLAFNNVEGLYPALDRKKLGKPYCVDGKNFIVDLDGPKSAFGYKQPWHEFEDSQFMQSFTIGSELFYFTRDVAETYVQVSKYNWPAQQILPIDRFVGAVGRPKLNLPWTHALVGTYHYFANRTWGVLRYDAINENWEDVTATIGVSNIFFITESDGRLITLAEGLTSWSAIEDGMDNTPSLTTGAGFQALSKIGSLESDADYLGLEKISNGYLSFTSKGVMRSQIIDSISPFRHITGESQEVPLTPWCITKINTTEVVILTRHGLFTSKDGLFQPWQPLMSEFFKQAMIPPVQHLDSGFVGLYYSRSRDEFYVYFASSQIVNTFTITYTLYLVRDSWGVFNHTHKGFAEIDSDASGDDFRQAFVGIGGELNWLDDSVITLVLEPQNAAAVYMSAKLEYPVFALEGVNVMPTVIRGHGFSPSLLSQQAGFYEVAGVTESYKTEEIGSVKSVSGSSPVIMPTDVTVNGEILVLGPVAQGQTALALDSYIEVGLFRFADEEANDELSLITNLAISCLDISESGSAILDDWLNDYASDVFEDWLAITPDEFEDWGLGTTTGSDYTETIKGTLDGYKVFYDQEIAPELVLLEGKTKFLTCENQGIFQSLRLDASQVGESFHLKTLELNGIVAGRL